MLSIKGNHDLFQIHNSKYAEHTKNEFHRWLSMRGMISTLAEHTKKCLKVDLVLQAQ
jgi:hypothetical protein